MQRLTASLFTLLFASSCTFNLDGTGGDGDSDEVRNLGSFTKLTNQSDANVIVTPDEKGDDLEPGDITIECDAGLVAHVDTTIDGGNLIIALAGEIASIADCDVRVIGDEVTEVVDEGDGDIICEGPTGIKRIEIGGNGSVDVSSVEAEELDILIEGKGSVNVDTITVDLLVVDIVGTGDVTLAGEAGAVDLAISGNGNFEAQELVAGSLDATIQGTGDAVLTVNGPVNASLTGEGSLDIYGDAVPGTIEQTGKGIVTFH